MILIIVVPIINPGKSESAYKGKLQIFPSCFKFNKVVRASLDGEKLLSYDFRLLLLGLIPDLTSRG